MGGGVPGAPEAPKEENKEEGDIRFVTKILKGASNNIIVFLPPLWLVFGRPHTPKVNWVFDKIPAVDNMIAKVHPLWTVPSFKDLLKPGVRHKARRKTNAVEEGSLMKKSDGEGYWLMNFTPVDPNANPMAAFSGKPAPPQDLEWIPVDNIVDP